MKTKKAVAVKYPEGAVAPIILAKGESVIAEKIISEAEKNKIYITENVELVELLGLEKVNDYVPESAYKILAAIFSFILENKKK